MSNPASESRPQPLSRGRSLVLRVLLPCALSVPALLPLTGCGSRPVPVPVVAVREAQVRSETYPLPLDGVAQAALLQYLRAGGNTDAIDDDGTLLDVVFPDAAERWGRLLERLGEDASIDQEDLSNGTYAEWFASAPLRTVVDARRTRVPVRCPSYALQQDRFEWIFECEPGKKLESLFIQLAIAPREEAP